MRDPCQPTDYLSVQLEFLNPKTLNTKIILIIAKSTEGLGELFLSLIT